MKTQLLFLVLSTFSVFSSFAEDSVICEDSGSLNVVLIDDTADGYTVGVQDFRVGLPFNLSSIIAKLSGERSYKLLRNYQPLSAPVQNLRLEFGRGSESREVIQMKNLDRLGDGDEFEALVYHENPGSPPRLVRKLACYYAQS